MAPPCTHLLQALTTTSWLMSVQSPSFANLKAVCVPLLAKSEITNANARDVLKLLAELLDILAATPKPLAPNLVSYVFYPISTLLRRNHPDAIPDQVLERIFRVLRVLCEDWWANCEIQTWEQIFRLCGSVLGGLQGKGKGKERDDETKEAAGACLHALTRRRTPAGKPAEINTPELHERFSVLQQHAQNPQFIPVLGTTIDSVLGTVMADHRPLQQISLKLLYDLVDFYCPDDLVPSILPGIVSTMIKAALGVQSSKGWTSGQTVADSLDVMAVAIRRSVGDEICAKAGLIRKIVDLEDLNDFDEISTTPASAPRRPFMTARTQPWLKGTSSQLLVALNSLTSLVNHPNPTALVSLSQFCAVILRYASQTLPQSQSLLLALLLSLSMSPHPRVKEAAQTSLFDLLVTDSASGRENLEVLIQITRNNLSALPRVILSQSDTRIEHVASQITAVSLLAEQISPIAHAIGALLGPNGGVEKWGWSLLSVLDCENPAVTATPAFGTQMLLDTENSTNNLFAFPELVLVNIHSFETRTSLVQMMSQMGQVAGEAALFSVEWFLSVGRSTQGSRSVAAFWCATRLLEGLSRTFLASDSSLRLPLKSSKTLVKFARGLAKDLAGHWDSGDDSEVDEAQSSAFNSSNDSSLIQIEHRKGLTTIKEPFNVNVDTPKENAKQRSDLQGILRRALRLQLISICSGILQSKFSPLLLHTLYPVLHSVISPIQFLSSTAMASLHYIANSMSSASPSNLLLSNFDYALDGVARRLSRRWLDLDAPRVLFVLVKLVGSDIVQRASDVVEECFDRLDEYHGYPILVERLMEVLNEILHVVEADHVSTDSELKDPVQSDTPGDVMGDFETWFSSTNAPAEPVEEEDFGPAPREPWKRDLPDEEAARAKEEEEVKPTLTQALTKQIISRSIFFLTHDSAVIRARVLRLLTSSVPVLQPSALLSSIHSAWPFILNRLSDSEPFVISAAAALITALSEHTGTFMYRRVWDDVWPRFNSMLKKLSISDRESALARRGPAATGTESAYTHSHRLHKSLLQTMTAAVAGVDSQDTSVWEVLLAFRRFLNQEVHEELQACARKLYISLGRKNTDAVWLVLASTDGSVGGKMTFMEEKKWNIHENAILVLHEIDKC